jgi:hypothetical protein
MTKDSKDWCLLKSFFLQLDLFDVCTAGDTAHIDTIINFLPHTRQHECIDILHCCNDPCVRHVSLQQYRYVPCHPRCTHRKSLVAKIIQFSCGCEQSHLGRSFDFLVINVCNHGEHYETSCIEVIDTAFGKNKRFYYSAFGRKFFTRFVQII